MTTIRNSLVRRSRPMASDIDVFGLTDQGKVRKENRTSSSSRVSTKPCRSSQPASRRSGCLS